jgi:hypothetical protein
MMPDGGTMAEMGETPNIADQTEREMIGSILRIYSNDEKACLTISDHIALKLSERRKIIRERRKHPCDTRPSEP